MKPTQAKTIAAVAAVIATIVIFFLALAVAESLSGPIQTQGINLRIIVALSVAAAGGMAIRLLLSRMLSSN